MNYKDYCEQLYSLFELHTNPAKAAPMQKYMRNKFVYFGIVAPERQSLLRRFIAQNGRPKPGQLEDVLHWLWEKPERELQYVAMELANHKSYLADTYRIQVIEQMLTQKSWWDTVDYIAANLAGSWFRIHPSQIEPVTLDWMESGNFWLQRSALIFQLKYKQQTNETLLYQYISKLNGSKEFFIQKAIGWALREYSKTNPESVKQFVESIPLSTLSRREALRIILKRQTNE